MPLLDKLLTVLAPHQCLVCQKEGSLICKWCIDDALPHVPSRCYRCHALTREFAVCDRCRSRTSLKQVWIRTSYEQVAKELVHGFKYERQRSSSMHLASAMAEVLPFFTDDICLVPVPTASIRRRQRGYDHALLLAREIATITKHPYASLLARLDQSRQVGAGRSQRFDQLKHAFHVTKPNRVNGKHIVLVDDIVTTGATLETISACMKQSGARRVDAIVFAQKR